MYRAKEPLYIEWARAHNPGDLIDDERVEQYGWQDKVEPVAEKKTGRGKASDETLK
jgi:hypothetical protein